MIRAFYTAAAGASAMQKGFSVTANNIANVSTAGYRAAEVTFSDLMYTNLNLPEGADTPLQAGVGVKVKSTSAQSSSNGLRQTENEYDFALTRPGQYFAVEKEDGVRYTRAGSFIASEEPDGFYLKTTDGGYVLDAAGGRIALTAGEEVPAPGVFVFANADALTREGDNLYAANERAGAPAAAEDSGMVRGALENSGVSLADEMTSVIELQRAFQLNSRMIRLTDEVMQTINSLK